MSIRRTSRRYLRNAVDASHELQEFLDENPSVAAGLASVGNLLVNAMMQSKYGPVIEKMMNPDAKPAARASAASAKPKAAKPAGKKPRGSKRTTKKKAAKKKAPKARK